jgi:RNA polymerase sigma-70 factor (ECF subfamily)
MAGREGMTEVLERSSELAEQFETHRVALTGYCYRMLGSAAEAEDAVQDAMLRAWRAKSSFEGRAAVRSWLFKIATNVCFDMLTSRQRRARPMELTPAAVATAPLGEPLTESIWVTPANERTVCAGHGDPADVAVARESVRLAFVAALQLLPPRQRAVLILREVLRWSAAEVAALLETSVPSVNSALQRARATLDADPVDPGEVFEPADAAQRDLLDRYVAAFTSYDIDALVGLLRDDVVMSMPPYPLWLRGPDQVRAFLLGRGVHCAGSRLTPVAANGMPAFAQWRADGTGWAPWAIQVLEIRDGAIAGLNSFLDVETLWPMFGLSREQTA